MFSKTPIEKFVRKQTGISYPLFLLSGFGLSVLVTACLLLWQQFAGLPTTAYLFLFFALFAAVSSVLALCVFELEIRRRIKSLRANYLKARQWNRKLTEEAFLEKRIKY